MSEHADTATDVHMPIITVPPEQVDRETHDRAQAIAVAALREVGYDPDPYWNGRLWLNGNRVPDDVLARARKIALDATGIPYKMVPLPVGASRSGDQ